ncbi:MAG: hypothetical protein ACOC56_02210 [Atribacterota bacterium]
MYSNYDIYCIFRKCQGRCLGRPYRLPKDWNSHFENKLKGKNKECLETITKYFNTKWSNIDPEMYFSCGFELFKNKFSYSKFFDSRILKLYITKDKLHKRNKNNFIEDIERSIKFVSDYLNEKDTGIFTKLQYYGKLKIGNISAPVVHYLKNKIGEGFLVYLMEFRYLSLEDHEINKIPYVLDNYKKILVNVKKIKKKLDIDRRNNNGNI